MLFDNLRRINPSPYGFLLNLGGEYLIIPLIAAELFGVKVLGRLLGVVLTADGVAEAVSPMLVGYLRDATGSYRIGFFGLILVALAGAVGHGAHGPIIEAGVTPCLTACETLWYKS